MSRARGMQAKDVPDGPVLEWLARQTRDAGWHSEVGNPDWLPTVLEAMPPGTPVKVALAKMRALVRRGLVDGCACGCRGDFTITDLGRSRVLAVAS